MVLGELYQLSFCKSHFGHNNSHFNTLSKHKIHLMYVNTLCVHKLETRITYKQCLDKKLTIIKVTKYIQKSFNYGIVTLLIINTNKHDQNFYFIVTMQHAIRLYNLMCSNVSMVNSVHIVNFVKGFARALVRYDWLTLEELYGSRSLTFNSIVEAEIVTSRTAQ